MSARDPRLSIDLTVSDPWEFGNECGVGPFGSEVVDHSDEAILVKLKEALFYKGSRLSSVIIRGRYARSPYNLLRQQGALSASFLFLHNEVGSLQELGGKETGVAAIGAAERVR